MIDPVSAFYGLKYGYQGTKAILEWLDGSDGRGTVEDIQEMKRVLQALAEDNLRLIELTQEHEKQLADLKPKAIGVIFVVIILNILATWAICASYHH